MTVSSTANKISYAGDGSTIAFAFPYYFLADGDLAVILRDSLGSETVQSSGAHYGVAGAGNQSGGTVTMVTAPASGETLVIQREVALTQGADYVANDSFPAETHETALDRLTMAVQQLDETLGRKLGVPTSDTATSLDLPIESARAGKFLGFDAGGNPIAAAGASANLAPVSAYIDTLLDDADAATARATLGVPDPIFTGRNRIINGCCRVGQGGAAALSTAWTFGKVDRIAAKADGTVGAGSIDQDAAATIGSIGHACKLAGVTLTGAGALYWRHRIIAKNAVFYKNAAAVFSAKALHDAGVAVDYTVTINKADAADNFATVTQIAASAAATSLASGTEDPVSLAVPNMGDCSNGIEIIVKANCGAVTLKNFSIADLQFELGTAPTRFEVPEFSRVLRECLYYFRKGFNYATAPADGTGEYGSAASVTTWAAGWVFLHIDFHERMFKTPIVSIYNPRVGGAAGHMTNGSGDDTAAPTIPHNSEIGFMIQSGGGALAANNWYANWEARAEP